MGYMLKFCIISSFLIQVIGLKLTDDQSPKGEAILGDEGSHLHWFIQISDIHVSEFYDLARISDLEVFCKIHIDIIKPEVVLASGDLTDAKHRDLRGSGQRLFEWKEYQRVLRETGVLNKTVWLDTRGNHDAFNVASWDDPANLYRYYSAFKKAEKNYHYVHRSKHYKHETDEEVFSFVTLDTCPNPAPRRPFNFFGVLYQDTADQLKVFEEESKSSDTTFWVGHYPTSVIHNSGELRNVLSRTGDTYMCGHLHTLNGYVPAMYTRHPTGNLELEVGDWKDNRIYRVFAVDHGMFSFSDQRFDSWPVILVTNPTHAQYTIYKHKDTHLKNMLSSTHIRILVFHDDEIRHVKVKIDDTYIGQCEHRSGPLYTVPWQPMVYSTGIHTMTVTVVDGGGESVTVSHQFSLNGTELPWNLLRHFILTTNISEIGKTLFIVGWFFYLIFMVLFRVVSQNVRVSRPVYGCLMARLFWRWIYKMQILTLTNKMFYSLIFIHVYLAIGPWFIGEVIDGNIGVCGTWGIYVNGAFIPGSLTYIYALIQMVLFMLPLTVYLSHCVYLSLHCHGYRARSTSGSSDMIMRLMEHMMNHGLFYFFICLHGFLGVREIYKAYGSFATLLGPVRTWSVVIAFVLRHWALNIDTHALLGYIKVTNGKIEHNS